MEIDYPDKNLEDTLCLVTGVTGYIGGRLVPELLKRGYRVRVLSRDASRLQGRSWHEHVEVVEGDVLDPSTLPAAMQNVDIAYYLIHSMSNEDDSDFHDRDLRAAHNFGKEANRQNLSQIVYLGGLGDPEDNLSKHLKSRHETGQALRQHNVPVTELRAAVVVGSGSMSFEMIRYLTERVPIMICPSWVYSKIQPIAIRDILKYLLAAIEKKEAMAETIEVGGRSVITYAEMMQIYAQIKGLKRVLLPVPVLSPNLSSHWVHWVTPVNAALAQPLIEGLKNDVIVRDEKAHRIFPEIEPISYEKAVRLALNRVQSDDVQTTWNDALISSQGDNNPVILETREGLIMERRTRKVKAAPGTVFNSFCSLGGETGWLAFNWAWKLRGILDRMVGGVGFRRGRRHPSQLRVGDALDFWRVEAVNQDKLLRLRAEMKVPGSAWLEFSCHPDGKNESMLQQTAYFDPKGLLGLLYWYLLYPIHGIIFSTMISRLAEFAEESD